MGWLGYSDDKVKSLADRFLREGFTAFKMKVGKDLEDDKRRLRGWGSLFQNRTFTACCVN